MTARSQAPKLAGLHVLLPKRRDEQREIDICFIHGLGGDPLRSWWHEHSTASDPWIADPAFMGDIYSQARIMTFGYGTDLLWDTNSELLVKHAHDLLDGLVEARQNCKERPLLFVAHSIGGVIVKQALVLCINDQRYQGILAPRPSIIFLGTPHEGSNQAATRGILRRLASLLETSELKGTGSLESHTAAITEAHKRFMDGAATELKMVSFYEAVKTPLARGAHLMVNKSAAHMDRKFAQNRSMSVTHYELCIFESPQDPHFKEAFKEKFEDMVRDTLSYTSSEKRKQGSNTPSQTEPDGPPTQLSALPPDAHQFSQGVIESTGAINFDSDELAQPGRGPRLEMPGTDASVQHGLLTMGSSSVHVDNISYNFTQNSSTYAPGKQPDMFSSFRVDASSTKLHGHQVSDLQAHEKARQTFLSSLVGFTEANLGGSVPKAYPGTCSWIREHPVFRDLWVGGPESKLLLITGDSGCGKSCLAKEVRKHLEARCEETDTVLAFFCNNVQVNGNESPILNYFVKELISRFPELYRQVNEYQTLDPRPGELTFVAMMDIFQRILENIPRGKLFLIIDGMDENDTAFIRVFLRAMRQMLQDPAEKSVRAGNRVRIAILSRPSPIIKPTALDLHIQIPEENVRMDIATFVHENIGLLDLQDNKSSVEAHIIKLAGHSFLWAVSVMAQLEKLEDTSLSGIMALFNKCPQDMENYYHQAVYELASVKHSLCYNLLEFVLRSARPLTKPELQAALNLSLERSVTNEEFENAFKRMTSKLIRTGEEGEVVLVHHSLREYLDRHRSTTEGHKLVFVTCLRLCCQVAEQTDFELLALVGDELIRKREELLLQHPFLPYTTHAFFHSRQCKEEISECIELIARLSSEGARLYQWNMLLWLKSSGHEDWPFLHMMASLGLTHLLHVTDIMNPFVAHSWIPRWFSGVGSSWLSFKDQRKAPRLALSASVLEVDGWNRTLLHASVECRQDFTPEFAWLYRKHSTDIDPQDMDGVTPLAAAVYLQNKKAVELLLSWGTDLWSIDNRGDCILSTAARMHSTDILRLLLERVPCSKSPMTAQQIKGRQGHPPDLDVDSPSRLESTKLSRLNNALVQAIMHGPRTHTDLLVEYGAQIRHVPFVPCCGDGKQSILHYCMRLGQDPKVYWLLTCIDVPTLKDHHGLSVLMLALVLERADYATAILEKIEGEQLPIASFECSVEPDRATLLHMSMFFDSPDTLHRLLIAGLPSDVEDKYGRSPLDYAVLLSKPSHAQTLIDHGCLVDHANNWGETALLVACVLPPDSALSMVDMLLRAGASPRVNESRGDPSPLLEAAINGYTMVITRLLDSEFAPDVNYVNKSHRSALHYACVKGNVEAARLLINMGADVNHQGIARDTVYFLIDPIPMLKLLFANGLKITCKAGEPSPITAAVMQNKVDALRLLITGVPAVDIDIEVTDRDGYGPPLVDALGRGHRKCAMLLIRHGCDATPTANSCQTAGNSLLKVAAVGNDVSLLRYLIDQQGWASCLDSATYITFSTPSETASVLETALASACYWGSLRAVRFLLSRGANRTSIPRQNLFEFTPLGSCVRSPFPGSMRIAKTLLSSGEFPPQHKNAALALAVLQDRLDMVRFLVESDADPCVEYWCERDSGLNFISLPGDMGTETATISSDGISVVSTSSLSTTPDSASRSEPSGHTPLQLAVRRGSVEIADALLRSSKVVNSDGMIKDKTLLHIAASKGQQHMISSLLLPTGTTNALTKPGNVELLMGSLDEDGFTALEISMGTSFRETTSHIDWLRKYMASSLSTNGKTIRTFAVSQAMMNTLDTLTDLGDDDLAMAGYQWLGLFAAVGKRHPETVCTGCDSRLNTSVLMVCRQCHWFGLCATCASLFKDGTYVEPRHASHQFLTIPLPHQGYLGARSRRHRYRDPSKQRMMPKKPRFRRWPWLAELIVLKRTQLLYSRARVWMADVKGKYCYEKDDGTVIKGWYQPTQAEAGGGGVSSNIAMSMKPVQLSSALLGINVMSQKENKGAEEMVDMEKVWQYVEETWKEVEGWEYIDRLEAFWNSVGDREGRVPDAYTP